VTQSTTLIRLGHSPDSDDAFMFYALAEDKVPTEDLRFEHVLRDIQTLNQWAEEGRLEVTAISVHAYAHVSDRYALLTHGASMGERYGPMVVAREPMSLADLRGRVIAIPGRLTSAYLALQLALGEVQVEVRPFDTIMEAVASGEVEAGLLIHEGQLTHGRLGLHTVLDLGVWWDDRTGLPLPLGVNAVRRDLGEARAAQLSRILRASIDYALAHRDAALQHSMRFARGMETSIADRFVGMYVNDLTRDMGERGRAAIERFLGDAHAAGLLPHRPDVTFVTD
jgi:1,4-dihydroxy-6-naphthoate synthase